MVVLTVGVGLAVIEGTPALAAGCFQASCNSQDPQTTGCSSGASNVASFYYSGSDPYLQGVLLELRRSTACDAAWARATNLDCLPMWRPCGFVLEVQGGNTQFGGGPGGGQKWTGMWSFRQYVRACFIIWNWDDTYNRAGCTAWN